jgi:phage-related minor tail protein
MSADDTESDFPSPEGMQKWLDREVEDIMKAAELRIKDAAQLVNRYSIGEISREEAAQITYEYNEMWGDALPGMLRSAGASNESIRRSVADARDPDFVKRLVERKSITSAKKRKQ